MSYKNVGGRGGGGGAERKRAKRYSISADVRCPMSMMGVGNLNVIMTVRCAIAQNIKTTYVII